MRTSVIWLSLVVQTRVDYKLKILLVMFIVSKICNSKTRAPIKQKGELLTSFNSRSNLVSGLSEPYRSMASAYVSLGKGSGSSIPLISRKICD